MSKTVRGERGIKGMEDKISVVKRNLKDHLTFYHELRMPQNSYFDLAANHNRENRFLLISSPSRMGNHLLLSLLDNHPELPRIPGEDGFLSFSFFKANYDIHYFLQSIRSENTFEFITHLGSNGGRNKWYEFKQCFLENKTDVRYSGVNVGKFPNLMDFEKTVFDINYAAFEQYLKRKVEDIRKAPFYNCILQIYVEALQKLDYEVQNTAFDSYIAFSGMRTQVQWVCETYENVKVLTSLRGFDSYCISHVKARHGNIDPDEDLIQEAWEHWYHKVIDMIYLKLKYPDKIAIVTFEDLVSDLALIQKNICSFLGIGYNDNLHSATIFGIPVKGNSWKSRVEKKEGIFYQPTNRLPADKVPAKAHEIWNSIELIKLGG